MHVHLIMPTDVFTALSSPTIWQLRSLPPVPQVGIKVLQGEREMAADNQILGNFDLVRLDSPLWGLGKSTAAVVARTAWPRPTHSI